MHLNIGMIGAGFIGQLAHLMNFSEVENCTIHALAEFKPLLREKVASRFGINKTYATHHELLQDPKVQAVVIVTPRAYTGAIVLDCLNAKKHVLSEKPMVGCESEARILLNAAEENQVKYAVGYMKRFDEGVEKAKAIIDENKITGELGDILSVQATCFMGNSYCNPSGHVITNETVEYPLNAWSIAPQWLPVNLHGGFAAYLNTYSHVTNLLHYLFNQTPKVDYTDLTRHPGQLVLLRFDNFLATLHTGKISHFGWSEEIKITFSHGELLLKLPPALLKNVPASLEIYYADKTQQTKKFHFNWTWAFKNQAQSFIDDILENRPMRNSALEAYKDIQLTETIWRHELDQIKQPAYVEKEFII